MSDPEWMAELERFINGETDDAPMPAWARNPPEWLREGWEPEWMRNPPEWLRYRSLRALQLARNGGSHTEAEWRALCAAYGHRCLRCKRRRPLTRDHVLPVVLGGSNNIDNIQPLCGPCNSSKGARHIDYRPEARAAGLLPQE